MRFVIVTGMSGGGKSTAMRLLEDMGFYCVDNLPVLLIDKFIELLSMPNTEISRVALGLDVRTDQSFAQTEKILRSLRQNGLVFEVLFMDASDSVLVKRYKESRRIHPLCTPEHSRIEDGIAREREVLRQIKKEADYVIDTSKLLTRELKLEPVFVEQVDEAVPGTVIAQDISPGTSVDPGTVITLTVSSGPAEQLPPGEDPDAPGTDPGASEDQPEGEVVNG